VERRGRQQLSTPARPERRASPAVVRQGPISGGQVPFPRSQTAGKQVLAILPWLRFSDALVHRRLHGNNPAGFAPGGDFEWPAAHFAIRGKPLVIKAGVNDHFTRLTAVRALDVSKFFHRAI
jgi:hypothetical protein